MGDYDGIKIRGPINIGSDPETSPALEGVEGETITWFKVSDRHLGMPDTFGASTRTPSELIQLWFGDDLTASDDGLSSNYRRQNASWAARDDWTEEKDDDWQHWRNTTTTAYMVTAVIGNLPPISTGTDGISGFLDWSQSWGLVYDADVLYKNQTGNESMTVAMAVGDDASAARINENLVSSMMERDWIVAGPDAADGGIKGETYTQDSVWPTGAYADIRAWYDDPDTFVDALTSFGSGKNRPMAYATYALEAVGYDAYDDLGADGATIDANEALHNNEIYRFAPPDASEEVMHAPGVLKADDREGFYQILWTYPWELHETFAGAYHAENDGDSYTHADSGNTWKKTHDQEIIDMNSTIDEVCKIIGPTLETTEFPKRFINHIQRKRKIPNNLVSAFGYVPEEMYTAGAVDSYVLGEDDKISYDPVTGEMAGMTLDEDGNPVYSSLVMDGVDMGDREGEAGTRGTEEGWDADAGGAGEDTDVGGTRYEGWDD